MNKKYFLITDLGSNSVRMDVIQVRENGLFRIAERKRKSCRLSEGLTEENCLTEEAMDRTVGVLRKLRETAEKFPLCCEFSVATEALRRAENREEFIRRAQEEAGFSFTVIDGRQEAYYDFLGAVESMPLRDFLLLDTGGGSSELVLVRDRKMQESCCIPYGSITLTEQFAKGASVNEEEYGAAGEMLRRLWADMPWLAQAEGLPVVGLGGSIRTVVKIQQRKKGEDVPVHQYQVFADELRQFREEILRMNHQQRKSIAGMDPLRADIITGGILPLDTLMEAVHSPVLIASANGLREGLCYEKCKEVIARYF